MIAHYFKLPKKLRIVVCINEIIDQTTAWSVYINSDTSILNAMINWLATIYKTFSVNIIITSF